MQMYLVRDVNPAGTRSKARKRRHHILQSVTIFAVVLSSKVAYSLCWQTFPRENVKNWSSSEAK